MIHGLLSGSYQTSEPGIDQGVRQHLSDGTGFVVFQCLFQQLPGMRLGIIANDPFYPGQITRAEAQPTYAHTNQQYSDGGVTCGLTAYTDRLAMQPSDLYDMDERA